MAERYVATADGQVLRATTRNRLRAVLCSISCRRNVVRSEGSGRDRRVNSDRLAADPSVRKSMDVDPALIEQCDALMVDLELTIVREASRCVSSRRQFA